MIVSKTRKVFIEVEKNRRPHNSKAGNCKEKLFFCEHTGKYNDTAKHAQSPLVVQHLFSVNHHPYFPSIYSEVYDTDDAPSISFFYALFFDHWLEPFVVQAGRVYTCFFFALIAAKKLGLASYGIIIPDRVRASLLFHSLWRTFVHAVSFVCNAKISLDKTTCAAGKRV